MVTGMEKPNLGPFVYESRRVIVIDKPCGWLSVPSRQGEEDARLCVGRVLEAQLGTRLWPVHRLDAEVSGLLLFAKDADAHRLLCAGFEHQQVRKTYLAWSSGPLPDQHRVRVTERWQSLLLRGKKRAYVHRAGKEAVTMATPLAVEGHRILWQLCPKTGRPHQLRVELFLHGCPILGDSLYGSTLPWPSGVALRAFELNLTDLEGRQELSLPPKISLLSDGQDYLSGGRAWKSALASSSGHSTHSACPAP